MKFVNIFLILLCLTSSTLGEHLKTFINDSEFVALFTEGAIVSEIAYYKTFKDNIQKIEMLLKKTPVEKEKKIHLIDLDFNAIQEKTGKTTSSEYVDPTDEKTLMNANVDETLGSNLKSQVGRGIHIIPLNQRLNLEEEVQISRRTDEEDDSNKVGDLGKEEDNKIIPLNVDASPKENAFIDPKIFRTLNYVKNGPEEGIFEIEMYKTSLLDADTPYDIIFSEWVRNADAYMEQKHIFSFRIQDEASFDMDLIKMSMRLFSQIKTIKSRIVIEVKNEQENESTHKKFYLLGHQIFLSAKTKNVPDFFRQLNNDLPVSMNEEETKSQMNLLIKLKTLDKKKQRLRNL
jgi:hypothetical protein